MTTTELINRMNDEAQLHLEMRRLMAGQHVHGIWRGQPNPYTVGSPGRLGLVNQAVSQKRSRLTR